MRSFITIIASIIILSSCSKKEDCGCVPPPQTETTWKVTKRFGGIAGVDYPLTDNQKNFLLTIKSGGVYNCYNSVTGQTVTGTYTFVNFSSIYGDRPRVLFSPQLPMITDEYMILLENANGKMVFGDNLNDGILTTFSIQ